MEIISVINQKGGVGKSTTAHALGTKLALLGNRVLFVDLDAQTNLSHTLGVPCDGYTVMDVLTKQISPSDAIYRGEKWDCIPGHQSLAGADMVLNTTGKEYRLKEALDELDEYDYIIIDTPPALGILTVNALAATQGIIIPAQADIYSLQGIGQLYNTIEAVRKYCNNPGLKIKGILLTRYSPRTVLTRDFTQMIEETAKKLDTILYKAKIRESVSVKEAQAKKKDIFSYAPKSNATADYEEFVMEVINNG